MNKPRISPPLALALAVALAAINQPISAELKPRTWDCYACELMPQRFKEQPLRVLIMRFIMGDRSMVIHCYYLRGGYRIRPLMYQDMATGDRLIAFELRGIVYLALRPNAYDVIKQGWFSLL